ncbi:hypothetical protein [Butyrivibrio hungatei]|uniref:hypothetical protein n=1 Tax=Butyrivibrio hungatei TaxID=185008 RepID=UPI0015A02828|nr:hypothetical protein [Butyrivibrio hungatei]
MKLYGARTGEKNCGIMGYDVKYSGKEETTWNCLAADLKIQKEDFREKFVHMTF